MAPVVADPVSHDRHLDIGMGIDEAADDLFEKFDPLLKGIEAGRPEIEERIRLDCQSRP